MSRKRDEHPSTADTDDELAQLDYYTLLGLTKDASHDEVRAAFRRFALRYHPDRFVDETEALAARALAIYRRGAEAFDVLSDPTERAAYDAVLARGQKRLTEDPAVLLRRAAAPAKEAPAARPAPAPKAAAPAEEKLATFGKPSERDLRAARPRRATKKSLRAMRAPTAKPAPAAPRTPPAPVIRSPQAKAFHDRAQAAIAQGDLRGAWRMLKAAVDAEPDNAELERALYAVERQFRA
jgi:curved DNA-binding protein CbpA